MFTLVILNSINISQYILFQFYFKHLFLLISIIFCLLCPSEAASISTPTNSSSSNNFEIMSNSSYRNFVLRQYFIDLLNISQMSLVRSMTYTHHIENKLLPITNARRKRSIVDRTSSHSPMFTLQSNSCFTINNQVQSTFIWSRTIEFTSSIELIYHMNTTEIKQLSIPLIIKFKHAQTRTEYATINTYLQYDSNRDFYFINIYQYMLKINDPHLIIESIVSKETCETIETYMIVSSANIQSKLSQVFSYNTRSSIQTQINSTSCRLKTIQIKFEDLGLAYLIIRPKEYIFTYCDGSCSYSTLQQQSKLSLHALFQSMVNKQKPSIPQPTCAPSQFADDNFLVRQMDGSMEIYPVKDVIVKQCACL